MPPPGGGRIVLAFGRSILLGKNTYVGEWPRAEAAASLEFEWVTGEPI